MTFFSSLSLNSILIQKFDYMQILYHYTMGTLVSIDFCYPWWFLGRKNTLNIPREIRNNIYSYCLLTKEYSIVWDWEDHFRSRIEHKPHPEWPQLRSVNEWEVRRNVWEVTPLLDFSMKGFIINYNWILDFQICKYICSF